MKRGIIMNQEKIGKFIYNCRKEKKLTQEQLAEKLNTTSKSVSRWENGKNLPDFSLFKPICNELDITVNELLNGEKDKNDNGVVDYFDFQKTKYKFKIIIVSIMLVLVIIVSVLSIFFINNYNKVNGYLLVGESDNFSYGYNDNLLILSNIKNIASIGNINIKNDNIKESDIKQITLKYNDKRLFGGNYLAGVYYENNGYDDYFPEDARNNIDKWYIEVEYVIDNKEAKEIINLDAISILKNDNLFYKKEGKVSDGTVVNDDSNQKKEYLEKVRNELLKNRGFKDRKVKINGEVKVNYIISKYISDKELLYYSNRGFWRTYQDNKDSFSGNIESRFVNYTDITGNRYIYNILEKKIVRCNNRICKSIDEDVNKRINNFVELYLKEFDGLINLFPNEILEDPIID